MREKTQQWMLIHASLMLAVGISAWSKGELFMFRAAAAFSFGIYYVLADVNRRDLLLTKANAVTTARLLLTLLLPDLFTYSPLLGAASAALVLLADGLDGYLARRFKQESEVGAQLDGETDAFFVLLLSLMLSQNGLAPAWLPLIGLLRYLWFFFHFLLKKEGQESEKRYTRAKYFAVFLMGTLTLGLWLSPNGALPATENLLNFWQAALLLSVLGVLYSFGRAAADFILNSTRPHLHARMFWGLFFLLSTLLAAPVLSISLQQDFSWGLWLSPTGEWLIWGILLLILAPLPKLQKPLRILTALLYALLFAYQLYRAFYLFTYGENPVFLYDFLLLRDVVPVFLQGLTNSTLIRFLPFLIGLPVILWMLGRMAAFWERLAEKLLLSRDKWAWALLFALFLPLIAILASPAGQGKAYRWITPHLLSSFHRGKDMASFAERRCLEPPRIDEHGQVNFSEEPAGKRKEISFAERQQRLAQWSTRPLSSKPDIYWIFIEAYGAVAQLSEETREDFRQLADSLEGVLAQNGWHISSAYSKAPIMGGRSWLSFTTALSGVKIENQQQYLRHIRTATDFPHFPRYLNEQGYATFRLSTMYSNAKLEKSIPRDLQNTYWGFDHFVGFRQIPYRGFRFDAFGGIPDQYALSYVRENFVEKAPAPRFLFAITMSSHYPYYLPPPVVQDWHELDTIKNIYPRVRDTPGKMLPRYYKVARYELEMLTQWILEQDGDALFVLLGDHQPAGLEAWLDGIYDSYATPLHIISRDSSLLPSGEGFYRGLDIPADAPLKLNHEDIYPLLLELLTREPEQ